MDEEAGAVEAATVRAIAPRSAAARELSLLTGVLQIRQGRAGYVPI